MSSLEAQVRPALAQDLPALLDLCGEHAAYEHAAFDRAGCAPGLAEALSGELSRLLCLVAESDGVIAYATATFDFSTWRGREFLHMDCLYVRAEWRGSGVGRRLFAALRAEAIARGIDQIQWQTPQWNVDAARFYRRLEAVESAKYRYRLDVS